MQADTVMRRFEARRTVVPQNFPPQPSDTINVQARWF